MRVPFGLLLATNLVAMLPAQKVGKPAAEITFLETFHFDGFADEKLSDLRGSAVLIEFWGDH